MNADARNCRISLNGYADRDLFDGLFTRSVPEVAAGHIWIVDVVREPGRFAKVAVDAKEGLNAASRCIGRGGSRIRDIENRLPGERISVLNYNPDIVRYVTNALDVDVESVVVTSKARHDIRAVVPVDQFAAAIGRDAHNVRLASALTGWRIAICTPECNGRRHVHPRFDTDADPSVWDVVPRRGTTDLEGRAG